jgi:hypothetical protein
MNVPTSSPEPPKVLFHSSSSAALPEFLLPVGAISVSGLAEAKYNAINSGSMKINLRSMMDNCGISPHSQQLEVPPIG